MNVCVISVRRRRPFERAVKTSSWHSASTTLIARLTADVEVLRSELAVAADNAPKVVRKALARIRV